MIVDSHHHLWSDLTRYPWLDGPGLAPIRRPFGPAELVAAGMTASVVVEGGSTDPQECYRLLELAAATPEIRGVVAWAELADPGLAGRVALLRAHPLLVGLRSHLQDVPDAHVMARAEIDTGLRTLAGTGLVFELLLRAPQLGAAAAAVARHPEVSFVLDHLGKPPIAAGELEPWASDLRALAAQPNVTAKLSGLVTEAAPDWIPADLRPYVETAVEAFGPERLMFGSDWPVCLLASTYAGVRDALDECLGPLSAPELAAIRSGTARRVYGLGGS